MQKPTQVLATASFRLGDNKESWADVLSQLNDQGRQGYALLTPSVRLDNPMEALRCIKIYMLKTINPLTHTPIKQLMLKLIQ